MCSCAVSMGSSTPTSPEHASVSAAAPANANSGERKRKLYFMIRDLLFEAAPARDVTTPRAAMAHESGTRARCVPVLRSALSSFGLSDDVHAAHSGAPRRPNALREAC